MTAISRDGSSHSPFGRWLRECVGLDSHRFGMSIIDVDWCIHRFQIIDPVNGQLSRERQNMMIIEEKTFCASVPFAQADTLSLLCQVMRPPIRGQPLRLRVRTKRGNIVWLRFWGAHLLRFSRAGPLDSDWIEWDGKRVGIAELVKILRFELSPITLRPRTERDHHGGADQQKIDFGK